MTLNLATLLEDSARRYPDRDAVVLGSTRLTYAQVDAAANQVANLLVEPGRPARRQGGAVLPEPALLPDRLLRHPQGRRRGRAAQRAAQGARDRLPPRRLPRRRPTSASRARPTCRWAPRATPASSRRRAVSTSS